MNKSFIVAAFLLGALTTPATFAAGADFATSPEPATAGVVSEDNDVLAAAGCCKQRAAGKPWRKTKLNFDSCKRENSEKDNNDNVFRPNGNVWWDVAC